MERGQARLNLLDRALSEEIGNGTEIQPSPSAWRIHTHRVGWRVIHEDEHFGRPMKPR
jgi:hypothetical protein